jgi:Ca-activated chloride channel family protein
MRFVHPEVCGFFLLLPLLLLLVRVQLRRRRQFVRSLGDPTLLQQTPGRFPYLHRPWCYMLLVLVPFLCTIVALADPRVPFGARRLRAGALDVVMVIDVSKSMAAEDYHQLSRLAKAREIMRQLLPAFAGNRTGLVTFAGTSFRQAELTEDLSALDFILQYWVDIDTAGVGGSNLVQALETGLALFPRNVQRKQIMLLFSDGGDDNEPFQDVLTQAVQRGISIHTFGLGGLQPSRIPQYDAHHRLKGFIQINGRVVTTQLNEAPLQHIAAATQGTYQRVTPVSSGSHLLTQPTVVGNTLAQEEHMLFQPFLLVGLLACGVQALLARL